MTQTFEQLWYEILVCNNKQHNKLFWIAITNYKWLHSLLQLQIRWISWVLHVYDGVSFLLLSLYF